MAKFKPQYRRLLFIDGKIRGRSYPNCSSLAEEWEVSTKTIQRDIDYIKYELDAPIEYDPQRHGYYYIEDSYQLPAVSVSESDLFAICIAKLALKQFEGTPLHQRLESVFDKIEQSLPDKAGVDPAWIDERILFFKEPTTRIDQKIWETIASAIRNNQPLLITHTTGQERRKQERKVDPYHLVRYRGEWYLSSLCHLRNSIRTFGVSRITRARILNETFVMPPKYDRNTMFGDEMGIIWKSTKHKVRIEFSPGLAPYIEEREWHPLQEITRRKNGKLILSFETIHINEVHDWILSWGPGARALAPKLLVDRVKASLEKALAAYD